MSRRSSGTALRAIVILTMLAVLPVLALGSAVVPDSVRDWLSRYWPAVKPTAAPSPSPSPQFQPVPATAVPPLDSTAPWQSGGENVHPANPRVGPSGLIAHGGESQRFAPAAASGHRTAGAPLDAPVRSPDYAPAALPPADAIAGRPTPLPQPSSAPSPWASNAPKGSPNAPDDGATSVLPISYQATPRESPDARAAAAVSHQHEAPIPMAEMPAAASPAGSGDWSAGAQGDGNQGAQFQSFQRRLHDLGATYLLLETWGSRQQLYRCFCKVAIGGNPNCTRHFEATDADPLRALAVVTEQVEHWQHAQP